MKWSKLEISSFSSGLEQSQCNSDSLKPGDPNFLVWRAQHDCPLQVIGFTSKSKKNYLTMDDLDNNVDGEAILLAGIRRSRRSTNWLYRGSSLTQSDRFDIIEMEEEAEDTSQIMVFIGLALTVLMAVAKHKLQSGLHDSYTQLTQAIAVLRLALEWLGCYLTFISWDISERIHFTHHRQEFETPTLRTIGCIQNNNQSEFLFGFRIHELHLLLSHLRIPHEMREDRHGFTGEEAMLVYFHYIRTGTPFTRMASIFGGDPRRYTYYTRAITKHIYNHFYHKISGDSMQQWLPFIGDFRQAIHDKLMDGIIHERQPDSPPTNWEVYIPYQTFRVFGWLDDTELQTNRPRAARPMNNQEEMIDTQQSFYNRYFRGHGLKAQVVHLPNGMIGSIFIGSMRHNDNGLQNMSGLNDYLFSILPPLYQTPTHTNVFPALYGDGIFATLATIIGPYRAPNWEQRVVNTRMSSLREDIEHKFSQVFGLYRVLRPSWIHNLFFNAEHVRKLFFTCLFMSNCYTCFNESRNRYFNLRAPSIDQYLPLTEVLVMAPTDPVPANPMELL